MVQKYEFQVDFTVSFFADSYEQAVRYADNKYPDNDGYTQFMVKTEEVGFYPTADTVKLMHEVEECECDGNDS